MNFDHLSSIAEDQDKGRWLTMIEPYEGKAVGVRLLVAGPDSNVQARARLKLADELADKADDEGRVSAENRETARIRNLARCVIGWRWKDADAMAREMMDEAFRAVRATRPTWNEGQPEWTIPANTLIERTRCVRCGKPLPEGHHKFCSDLCASAHGKRLAAIREADEARAVLMAIRWT